MKLDEIRSYVQSKKTTLGHWLLLINIHDGSSISFAENEIQRRLNNSKLN